MGKRKKHKKQYSFISQDFLDRLATMYDQSIFDDIIKTFVTRPTTFRVNTLLSTRQTILDILKQQGFKIKMIPWYTDAFILENKTKRELTDLDIYTQGHIYIQSLASMLPPLILSPQPGETVLDLTAAPGSKTSQIAGLMHRQGELIANDKNKIRFFKLKANMENLGVVNSEQHIENDWKCVLRMESGAVLTQEYPEYFDKILLDAPCSAEARFVEDDIKSFAYWKRHKIKEMAYTQRTLLFSAWQALKPGGILLYSTCTFAPEENEIQISRFLERNDNAILMPAVMDGLEALAMLTNWKDREVHPDVVKYTLRIKPTKYIEGFFVAKIQKKVNSK